MPKGRISQAKVNARDAALRRRQFAALYLQKMPMSQIAAALAVTERTCTNYRAQLEEEWQKTRGVDHMEKIKARELAVLEDMEYRVNMEFEKSGVTGSRSPKWLNVKLSIQKRRADLMGLDKESQAADAASAEKAMALDFAAATLAILAEVALESGFTLGEDVLDGTPDKALSAKEQEAEDADFIDDDGAGQ